MTQKRYYFFIGTTAEFLKVMPVMRELTARNIPFKIIASGQNTLALDDVFAFSGANNVDIVLTSKPVKKSALGLGTWFVKTLLSGLVQLRGEFRGLGKSGVLIVHGDTVSTVMGALIGRWYGMRVAHVEAGLRSFNFLQPFPEEIDRFLTSYLADIHFCPLDSAVRNLQNRRGVKINTGFNTNIDSLMLALGSGKKPAVFDAIGSSKYCIFIMHRQENLFNKDFAMRTVRNVLNASQQLKCVFVMHDLTRTVLEQAGMLQEIEVNDNVVVIDRLPYFEFIELLKGCEFMVTDGGGNQQEAYYLGKPCLLLRNVTEGNEGLDHNIVLAKSDAKALPHFIEHYENFIRPMIVPERRPSEIIVDTLTAS